MFFGLVTNNLQVFLISSEILVKMLTYVSPLFYYFFHDHKGHRFVALGLCQMQKQWVTPGVVFLDGIFEGSKW